MPAPTAAADDALATRWKAVRACVCLGLGCGMLLSWRLWLSSGRQFPVLSCFGLGPLPAPADWALLLAAFGLAAATVARPWNRWLPASLFAVMVVLGLLDQMRWQPWAYQYLLCLVPLACVAGREDRAAAAAALDGLRLIVIAIYVWSGIHKFGVQFQRTYESDVVVSLLSVTSGPLHDLIRWSGHLVPWTEILIGLALIAPRLRQFAIWLALGTHAFILLMLGPFGTASNSVIWPWNLAMAGLVVSLFWRLDGWALRQLFSAKRLLAPLLAIAVLVLLMPAWSYSKRWNQYFSFHLYSGHHQRMALIIENREAAALGKFFRPILRPAAAPPDGPPTHQELAFSRWSMIELNVPMPSEDALLLRVAKEMIARFDLSAQDFFYRDYPELLEERGFDQYPPAEIKRLHRFPDFRYGKPTR